MVVYSLVLCSKPIPLPRAMKRRIKWDARPSNAINHLIFNKNLLHIVIIKWPDFQLISNRNYLYI